MDVRELNREQLIQLKQNLLCEREPNVSYGELAAADELITDAEVFEQYAGTSFVEEDFT